MNLMNSMDSSFFANVFLLVLAILPSFLLGFYVYIKDEREKESSSLLANLFVQGILSALVVIFVSIIVEFFFGTIDSVLFEAFIGVALVEELAKWIFVYRNTWNHPEFNHIYDAIVYSVFVSLGFATFENLLYVFSSGESFILAFFVAILRSIASVPGHAFFAVFMGYYLGLAKLSSCNKNELLKRDYLFLSVLIPVLCHGFFDFCLMTGNLILIIIFVVFVIFLYISAFSKIRKHSEILAMFPLSNIRNAPSINNNCPVCGTIFEVGDKYCSECGNNLLNHNAGGSNEKVNS